MKTLNYANPKVKAICLVFVILSCFLIRSVTALTIAAFVLTAYAVYIRAAKAYFGFVVLVILPIFLISAVLWWQVIGAPPNQPIDSNPVGGLHHAVLVSIRLLVIGAITQLFFLGVKSTDLPVYLKKLGFNASVINTILTSISLVSEMKLKIEHIFIARSARGLIRKRTYFSMIGQLPYILRPLLIWVLNASIERSENWEKKHKMSDVLYKRSIKLSNRKTMAVLAITAIWVCICIVSNNSWW